MACTERLHAEISLSLALGRCLRLATFVTPPPTDHLPVCKQPATPLPMRDRPMAQQVAASSDFLQREADRRLSHADDSPRWRLRLIGITVRQPQLQG